MTGDQLRKKIKRPLTKDEKIGRWIILMVTSTVIGMIMMEVASCKILLCVACVLLLPAFLLILLLIGGLAHEVLSYVFTDGIDIVKGFFISLFSKEE